MKMYRVAWFDPEGRYRFEDLESVTAALLLYEKIKTDLDPSECAAYMISDRIYKLESHVKGE